MTNSNMLRTVGTLPDRRLAFFAGPKKVSKEKTTPAAGISHAMPVCCALAMCR